MIISKKNITKKISSLVLLVVFFLLLGNQALAAVNPAYQDTQYFGLVPLAVKVFGVKNVGDLPKSSVSTIAGTLIGSVLSFLAIVFFILIVYGGGIWMIARGNQEEVTKAKGIIIDSSIGLIIVLSAWTLTWFVTKMVFGSVGLSF